MKEDNPRSQRARLEFRHRHRLARLGALGTLATSLSSEKYEWFLCEVYDLRFPHVGSCRHRNNRSFDSLRGKLVKIGGEYQRLIF